MTAYYNEIDKDAAQWLRNLIDAGHIAYGHVDERSIEDVRPSDLKGFTQCHFFAGIGVWSYALRKAGWADDRPVWTGSCPCQPFSSAGKGAAFDDERHLWPAFHHLIKECKPSTIFGEQVASKDADAWLDLVQDDLEAVGYSIGAIPFPSAGVGAPHIRDRLYWLANSDNTGPQGHWGFEQVNAEARWKDAARHSATSGIPGWMAHTDNKRCDGEHALLREEEGGRDQGDILEAARCSESLPNTSPTNGFWSDADWLFCRDGKWRAVEPSTSPLAHGITSRVVRLRAYGNAINAEAAKTFIECAMECVR